MKRKHFAKTSAIIPAAAMLLTGQTPVLAASDNEKVSSVVSVDKINPTTIEV